MTTVTEQRHCHFGDVVDMELRLSHAGEVVASLWQAIPQQFPGIEIDAWVLMPNHLHGIVAIPSTPSGEMDPTAPNLSAIVHWFKTRSTIAYGEGVRAHDWPRYQGRLWQSGVTDRILRNDRELDQKRAYIAANPSRWQWDDAFPSVGE